MGLSPPVRCASQCDINLASQPDRHVAPRRERRYQYISKKQANSDVNEQRAFATQTAIVFRFGSFQVVPPNKDLWLKALNYQGLGGTRRHWLEWLRQNLETGALAN
jgi:hypothetical protein